MVPAPRPKPLINLSLPNPTPSGLWQLLFEPLAVSVGLATPLQGSALFHAGIFGWTKNLVVLLLVLPNHALFPQYASLPPPLAAASVLFAFVLMRTLLFFCSFMWSNRPVPSIILFATTPLNLFAFFLADLPVISTIGAVGIVYAGLYYHSSRSLESRGRMII
jgi:hypothetical protein